MKKSATCHLLAALKQIMLWGNVGRESKPSELQSDRLSVRESDRGSTGPINSEPSCTSPPWKERGKGITQLLCSVEIVTVYKWYPKWYFLISECSITLMNWIKPYMPAKFNKNFRLSHVWLPQTDQVSKYLAYCSFRILNYTDLHTQV